MYLSLFSLTHLSAPYQRFAKRARALLGRKNVITHPLLCQIYSVDASYFRLIPRVIVFAETETQISQLIAFCHQENIPLTFRTAGTSLSGQAQSNSVLIRLSEKAWQDYQILDSGKRIRIQVGLIASKVNRLLAGYGRRLGPDPASIDIAKIGGIVANNASGMCCGIAQNTYQTLDSIRIILWDGSLLDTGDTVSRTEFTTNHAPLLNALSNLRGRILSNPSLAEKICHKYHIKNTVGYSLNAFIDYEHPIDILAHLMVGSEGTLGFVSSVVVHSVIDHPYKATGFFIFPNLQTACDVVVRIKETPVAAAEIMDRKALKSAENQYDINLDIARLAENNTALLLEVQASDPQSLLEHVTVVKEALARFEQVGKVDFTTDATIAQTLWAIRKNISIAREVREQAISEITEDVAFPIKHLTTAIEHLQNLFTQYGYDDALIYGHALAGNLHFVFSQSFADEQDRQNYQRFMDDISACVLRYDGSLKAEHGTGRAITPFVELEWGQEAYQIMQEIKTLFDPQHIFNPDVIISQNPNNHVTHLKLLPVLQQSIDSCVECGFCEPSCPSRGYTLTPRERIVGLRALATMSSPKSWQKIYQHYAIDSCVNTKLCARTCPYGIDTGGAMSANSADPTTPIEISLHKTAKSFIRQSKWALHIGKVLEKSLGNSLMHHSSLALNNLISSPVWLRKMPYPANKPTSLGSSISASASVHLRKIIYYPTCANRIFGMSDPNTENLPQSLASLFAKAGYQLYLPEGIKHSCCGKALEHTNNQEDGQIALQQTLANLAQANDVAEMNEKTPIVVDASSCAFHLSTQEHNLTIVDVISFVADNVLSRINITQKLSQLYLHIPCSTQHLNLEASMQKIAEQLAEKVILLNPNQCCGFAGQMGFTQPNINQTSIERMDWNLANREGGEAIPIVSANKMCEIGLANQRPDSPVMHILQLLSANSVAKTMSLNE